MDGYGKTCASYLMASGGNFYEGTFFDKGMFFKIRINEKNDKF